MKMSICDPTKEPQFEKIYLQAEAHSEDSDQPAHPRSPISLRLSLFGQPNIQGSFNLTVRTDLREQADLSLYWTYMSVVTFSHFADQRNFSGV